MERRGLAAAPEIAVGDGAPGFWKALDEVLSGTRHQRCWLHKIANFFNRVPKSVQGAMKGDIRKTSMVPTRTAAEKAIAVFVKKYGAKYPKTAACLSRDREALLAFSIFPAEHWNHLRTTNPIESVFATVILTCADQNPFAQSRRPMLMMSQGWSVSLFHASQQWPTMSS